MSNCGNEDAGSKARASALEKHSYMEVVCWDCPTYRLGCEGSNIEECMARDQQTVDLDADGLLSKEKVLKLKPTALDCGKCNTPAEVCSLKPKEKILCWIRRANKVQQTHAIRLERDRIHNYLMGKYSGVGKNTSRTAKYAAAKELCIELVLRGKVNP